MRVAWYPGSFFPFHAGHADVLGKALASFEHVVVAIGVNPEKDVSVKGDKLWRVNRCKDEICKHLGVKKLPETISVIEYKGLLVDAIEQYPYATPVAIIKGIRNSSDFEYEKVQQYWNEDLGIKCPTFLVIADRNLTHISSTALKAVSKARK